jgi:RHS repeat-associated protein
VKTAYHVYWPYGEELTSATQDAERMKFTGHERDLNGAGGTGDDLDYMHARFCSPVTGRFLGVDAIGGSLGAPQSWNRYFYSLGNPVKYLDPNGKDEMAALSRAYTATASAIIGFGSAVQEVGDDLNQGGALGIAADTALGTAGSMVQGFGDLFNLGTSTGDAIGSGGDSFDIGNALAADMGRAGGLALMLAGPAVRVGGTTPLFRAVTPAETTSLAETGAFSPSPTGSMSKGFFFKAGDAESFAAKITTRTGETHTVVAAEAPTRLVKSSPPHSAAGEGPGVYIPNSRLSSVKLKARPQ